PLATVEAPPYTHAASAPAGPRCRPGTAVGPQRSRPLVERWRCPHARSLSPVLVRPHGFALAVGYSAPVLVGFMNRPFRKFQVREFLRFPNRASPSGHGSIFRASVICVCIAVLGLLDQ